MKILTLDDWKYYFWDVENSRFAGVKFENLVASLLKLEYPEQTQEQCWNRTDESWDGKRDFFQYYMDNGKKALRWAECKAYRDAISFNILAPTLIMSTLRNTNEVLFFSYSRLNREAIKGLQEFASVHKKRIRVYDDEKLEALIFRYKGHSAFDFSTYFRDPKQEPEPNSITLVEHAFHVYVCRHNTLYSMEKFKKVKLRVNELFEIHVSLINQTLKQQQVMVDINMEEGSVYRTLDAENRHLQLHRQVTLLGGEATEVSFTFKITSFSRSIKLPNVRITIDGKEQDYSPGNFWGSWLLETPYLGDISLLDSFVQHSMSDFETVCTVFGPSGVGKTRLMRELQGRRLLLGYKCLWSDADHANGRAVTWLRQILSRLYALPLISVEHYIPSDFPNVKERVVIDVLYDNNFKFDTRSIDALARALLLSLERQKTLLIVDNVQAFDSVTIQILNSMLNNICDVPGAHMLISFNSDYLYQQEMADALFQRLERLHRDDKDHYIHLHVTGLGKGYPEQFIRYCFSDTLNIGQYTEQEWRTALRQIVSVAGTNPLYLEQLLLHLCENDILRAEEDHLYLFDNYKLPQCLAQLPASTGGLLDKRWKALRKAKIAAPGKMERVLRFLCFFGELPPDIVAELDLDDQAIDTLMDAGFLRQEEYLTFYHPLISKFFRIRYATLTSTERKLCLHTLTVCAVTARYPAQFHICMLKQNKCSVQQVDNAIGLMITGEIPPDLVQSYGDVLFNSLHQIKSFPKERLARLLDFYRVYCFQQKQFRSLTEVLDIYISVYEKNLKLLPEFLKFGRSYFDFIKEYLNVLLTEHKNQSVVDLSNQLLERMDEFYFDNPAQAEKAKAMLFNRMHVAINRIDPPSSGVSYSQYAQELLETALEISYNIQDVDGIIQNEIDYGNVFYITGGSAKAATVHWEIAAQEWEKHSSEVPLWEGGVIYHLALSKVMFKELDASKVMLERVFRYHERTLGNPYFYVKALTLYAVVILMEEKHFEEVLEAINKAEDACTSGGFIGIFPVCSHARAIAYEQLAGDQRLAAVYYEKALTQYIARCEQAREEERIAGVLESLAIALRSLRGQMYCGALSNLKNRTVAATLLQILDSNEDVWQDIQLRPCPKSIFYLEETGISYPCV